MRTKAALLTAALLLGAMPAQATPRAERGQAELEEALKGRTAGEPVDCLRLGNIRSTRIIDDTAILYTTDGTIYVNRPRSGARSLDDWDVLVTEPFGSQLCRVDVVRTYDRDLRFQTGFVSLGDFVPYRKADARR